MKGQFSRLTARRARHYSSVRLQQGRVQLDADFNEQVDIALRRDQVTTLDTVGQAGVPVGDAGFGLAAVLSLTALDAVAGTIRAVGTRGTVAASGDGGTTWALEDVPPAGAEHDLLAVSVLDASHAMAVSASGEVLLQSDGATWVESSPAAAGGVSLRAAAMLSATSAWAAGDGGLLLVSADGGATWNARHAAGVTETLRALHFPTTARGWAVGDAGRIVATADSGATWVAQAAPAGTAARLHAVRFAPDAKHGWAVGDGATILATANGGTTWASQTVPAGVDATLRGLDVVDPTTAWAVGDRGTVIRTTDGGATWAVVAPDTAWAGTGLRAVRAASADSAQVAGDLSVLASVAIAGGVATWQPSPSLPGRDLSISAGRIYVDGIIVELDAAARYLAQPGLPAAAFPGQGAYRSYLDVWTRHLTALDRPELREVALGGPDTATRTQTVWQVRIDPTPLGPQPTCASLPAGWRPGDVSGARLRARGAPTPVSTNDCLVPAGGGYRRLENLLYRVEVHTPGAAGTATFTWSRDNGAVVARLASTDPAGNTVTVDDPGRDPGGDFAGAALIELTDDARLLAGQPGMLLAVQGVTGPVIQVVGGTPVASAFGPGAIVRRWDGTGTVSLDGWHGLAPSDGAVPADGIEVDFAGGDFLTGDYWTLPARTLTGDVEWPAVDGAQQFLGRDGEEHHYAQLGIVTVSASGALDLQDDCRIPFAPLTDLDLLVYSSGDGQEVPRGGPLTLPDPAVVAVTRGPIPVPGATVRFTLGGGGTVNGGTVPPVVTTDANGLAAATWELDDIVDPQHLTAELVDASGAPRGTPPVTFQARVRSAASISYEPACPDLAGATTVQAALDALCARPSGGAGCCHLVGRTEAQAGEYEDLAVALKELIVGRKEVDVCICLLPGEYGLRASYLRDVLAESGAVERLEIGGAGARLRLVPDATITGAGHISFRDLELVASDGSVAAFVDTPDQAPDDRMAVDLAGVTIRASEAPNGAALLSFDLCGAVRITGCELTTTGRATSKVHDALPAELSAFFDAAATADAATLRKAYATLFTQPLDARVTLAKELAASIEKNPDAFGGDVGTVAKRFVEALQVVDPPVPNPPQLAKMRATWAPLLNALAGAITLPSAVVFTSVCSDVMLSGNRIRGGIALAGPGRNPPAELAIETALRGHGISPSWSGSGRLHLDANTLDRMGLGADAAVKLADTAGDVAKAQLAGVAFAEVLLTNNTFSGAPIAVLGETVSVSGNLFQVGAPPVPGAAASRLGFVASVAGAATGNIGPSRASRATDAVAELVLDGADRGASGNVRLNIV